MALHESLDFPEELRPAPGVPADTPAPAEDAPRHSLAMRIAVLVVVVALVLMTVGVSVFQSGLVFPM